MIKTICLHQVFPPSFYSKYVTKEGEGNCRICVHDEKNRECKMYYPINVLIDEVTENK